MTTEILLSIPDDLYDQMQQEAVFSRRDVSDIVIETLAEKYQLFPADPRRAKMEQEEAAFKALHPKLVKQYLGQYVAVYEGQVVDHDQDIVHLMQRVRPKLPEQVVLYRKVETISEVIIRVRHPRIQRQP